MRESYWIDVGMSSVVAILFLTLGILFLTHTITNNEYASIIAGIFFTALSMVAMSSVWGHYGAIKKAQHKAEIDKHTQAWESRNE